MARFSGHFLRCVLGLLLDKCSSFLKPLLGVQAVDGRQLYRYLEAQCTRNTVQETGLPASNASPEGGFPFIDWHQFRYSSEKRMDAAGS